MTIPESPLSMQDILSPQQYKNLQYLQKKYQRCFLPFSQLPTLITGKSVKKLEEVVRYQTLSSFMKAQNSQEVSNKVNALPESADKIQDDINKKNVKLLRTKEALEKAREDQDIDLSYLRTKDIEEQEIELYETGQNLKKAILKNLPIPPTLKVSIEQQEIDCHKAIADLKKAILENLHLYPFDKHDPSASKKYQQNPLAYWKQELQIFDIVLKDIENVHYLYKCIRNVKVALSKKKTIEPISAMQLTTEEQVQDFTQLAEIDSAIEGSQLYDEHYSLYENHRIHGSNQKFIISLNTKDQLMDLESVIKNIYISYIEEEHPELSKTFYRNTVYSSISGIIKDYPFALCMREAIAEKIAKIEAKEQGNEPSTFNKEMEGLSLVSEQPPNQLDI